MSNVATRLLSLILLLQSRPCWKAAELAHELGVSERTIHRYMSMLDEMGIPIYSERGPYGGFSLVRGYRLPPLIFSAEEATVLYMGANLVRDVWGRTFDDAVTSVTAKLDNVLPDDLRHQVTLAQHSLVVDGLTARNYRPWDAALHTLRQCILEHHSVRLVYRAIGRPEPSCRVIEPYALTFQWGLWYLIGFCHLRQTIRTFRVDRVQEVSRLEYTFTVPADFSVREYLARTLWFEPAFQITVHIDACAATKVRDTYGHWMDLTEHADGSLTATFGVHSLDWATGWVLGLGEAARAIEPPELIERVVEAAQGALEQYKEQRQIGCEH
jgi:predicted DNA-binding transcriptional regulator YafY